MRLLTQGEVRNQRLIRTLETLATDGVPRGPLLIHQQPFHALLWLEEDLRGEFRDILPFLRQDFARHAHWYRENGIELDL